MEGASITEKIVSDAEIKAEETVADAKRRAEEIIAAANRRAEEIIASARAEGEKKAADELERRRIEARLDGGRLVLKRKTEVLGGVYKRALEILSALPEEESFAFTAGLIEKYAEEGDEIVLPKGCAFAKRVESLGVVAERKLTLSKEDGDFSGGVILVGKTSDKRLTLEALVRAAEEKHGGETAANLF